ncbi:pantoate--beta-alanine ligase [Virgibacillus byunsanensis]|uniref:Pantothenate synthetase n=1 Tax=Virgibacillus byunsanensis TaxID=570945 RepID=A0ABW3LJU3_9BACI
MEIIRSLQEMQLKSLELIRQNKQIGFVATMGFFHEGHTNLMKRAKQENDIVVTSIFVNPLQFGPSEDFEQYPRDEQQDTTVAEQVGVDYLFLPEIQDMYPTPLIISMNIEDRADVLCGRSRPGHFEGVITVLSKLFHIIQPSKTYFGMKDAQQVAVVDALIKDLNFPIELIPVSTTREKDGLAKSSRNVYLTNKERQEAPQLYGALNKGRKLVVDGETNTDIIVKEVMDVINNHTSGRIDYVELLSYPQLEPVSVVNRPVVLAVAVHFNRARLIDNLLFDEYGNLIKQI